jgi:hypothetical protein
MGPVVRTIVRRRLREALKDGGYTAKEATAAVKDVDDKEIDKAGTKASKRLKKSIPTEGPITDWIIDNQDLILMIVQILLGLFLKKAKENK